MSKCFLSFFILIFSFFSCLAVDKDKQEIMHVLQMQANEWNKGSIDNYMKGYWNNDSLVFIGKSGPTYGYQSTLARYKNSYSDVAKMGMLDFSNITVQKLSPYFCFVTGHWHLQRAAGNLEGYFTLLFKKINDKWLIICDHSS